MEVKVWCFGLQKECVLASLAHGMASLCFVLRLFCIFVLAKQKLNVWIVFKNERN